MRLTTVIMAIAMIAIAANPNSFIYDLPLNFKVLYFIIL